MKDSEFIELLNLYLDHEISAADAARLETEVQGNPARRRIYQEYCHMQKACTILSDKYATEAAELTEPKVVAFDAAAERRARMGNFYVFGAITAAAACVAIIFVGHSRKEANELAGAPASSVKNEPKPAAPAIDNSRAIASTVSTTPSRRIGAGLNAGSLSLSSNAQANAMRNAVSEQTDAQFSWISNTKLAPLPQQIPIDQLRFDSQPAVIRTESRTFGNQPLPSDIERTAFRFQK
jgi:hypothetical protein